MRNFLALLLYRLVFLLLSPILVLILVIRSINHPKYRQRIGERFGVLSPTLKSKGIVVHGASVGEIIALKPFITQLISLYPNLAITVTTFTPTGSAQVEKLFGAKVQHCYLPLDNMLSTHFFLQRLQPQAMVFMETELWPNLIAQCKSRAVKLLLVNGRLSDKSMRSYQKLSWLITPTIRRFDQILTQSQVNQDNYLTLGADARNCQLSGNLKFDIALSKSLMAKQHELTEALVNERKTFLIASTHPGDEALALAAFTKVKQHQPNALLIIVPRHPERFEHVVELARKANNQVVQRSKKQPVTLTDNVWVIDTLGELLAACSLANVVVMGGSFSNIGGHNPLEPALFKKPVIVGPDMNNFSEILLQLKTKQGIKQLEKHEATAETLANEVVKLFNDQEAAAILGENGYKVVKANQGATERSLKVLQQLMTAE